MASFTPADYAHIDRYSRSAILIEEMQILQSTMTNVWSNTYYVIEIDADTGQLNAQTFFERDGCNMVSCLPTKIDWHRNCSPVDKPFSQKLQDGSFVNRCQPVCFNVVTGSKTSEANTTDNPAPVPYVQWRHRHTTRVDGGDEKKECVVDVNSMLAGRHFCSLVNSSYLDALLNPYLTFDEKWGLEPWGLNLSSTQTETDIPVFGRVHQDHCTFFKERFKEAETDFTTPSSLASYYKTGDNECGMNKWEKYTGFVTGNWLVRALRSRPNPRDLEVVDPDDASRKIIPAAVQHLPTHRYLDNLTAWKSYVNRLKVSAQKKPIDLSTSVGDLFTVRQRGDRLDRWCQVFWTNKADVLEMFTNPKIRNIPITIKGVKYEFEDTYGGVVVTAPPLSSSSSFQLNKIVDMDLMYEHENPFTKDDTGDDDGGGGRRRRRAKRNVAKEVSVFQTKHGAQLNLENILANVTSSVYNKMEELIAFFKNIIKDPEKFARGLNKIGDKLGESLTKILLNPDTYTQVLLDAIVRQLVGVTKNILAQYLERLMLDVLRQCVQIGLEQMSSKLIIEAGTVTIIDTVVVRIATSLTVTSISSVLSVITVVLTISQLMDLFWAFVWDPFGLAKPADGDPVYRSIATLQAINQARVLDGRRAIEWTPSLFVKLAKQGDDSYLARITAAQAFSYIVFAHNLRINSDGQNVEYARDFDAKQSVVFEEPNQEEDDGDTNNNNGGAIPDAFINSIRSVRARQMIITPIDAVSYEQGMATRALNGVEFIRKYSTALVFCFLIGIVVGKNFAIISFILIGAIFQSILFFILWGNKKESKFATKMI